MPGACNCGYNQSVKIIKHHGWRVSTDPLWWDWGWFVDDVRIYTCGTDAVSPTDPAPGSLVSTSHTVGVPSTDNVIVMEWGDGADTGGSGLAGYSVLFVDPYQRRRLIVVAAFGKLTAIEEGADSGILHEYRRHAADRLQAFFVVDPFRQAVQQSDGVRMAGVFVEHIDLGLLDDPCLSRTV